MTKMLRDDHLQIYRPGGHVPSSTASSSYYEPYDRYDRGGGRSVQPYREHRHDRHDRPDRHDRRERHNLSPRSDYSNLSSDHDRPRRNRSTVHRRRSHSHLSPARKPEKDKKPEEFFRDHGAPLVGAAAGGLAGHQKGGDPLKTASSAAVGAIGAIVAEKQYRKWNDKREDRKVGREVRKGSDDTHGRHRTRSVGRERDRTPDVWQDTLKQIKRSLSRKGGRKRSPSYDLAYSR